MSKKHFKIAFRNVEPFFGKILRVHLFPTMFETMSCDKANGGGEGRGGLGPPTFRRES